MEDGTRSGSYALADLVLAVSKFAIVFTGELVSHKLTQGMNLNSLPGRKPVVNFHKQISSNVFLCVRIHDAGIC
jgi:hypothetical protein